MADLSVKLGSVTLKNPLVSGGGPVAGTPDGIRRCADAGFGAIITKTVTGVPDFRKYPRPHYFMLDYDRTAGNPNPPAEWSWMHLDHNSSYPADIMAEFIAETAGYCKERDCVLIGSIAGGALEEWQHVAKKYVEAGAGALELNFCCPLREEKSDQPVVARTGQRFGDNPDEAIEVIKAVQKVADVPLFGKMPPTSRGHIVDTAKQFTAAGLAGMTMYANSAVLKIDIESGTPLGYGCAIGRSRGHMLDSVADTARVAKEVPNAALMSGRGAYYWYDVVEFLMAGAAAVQLSAIFMVNGPRYIGEMLEDMSRWLDRKGYDSVRDIQGIVLPKIYLMGDLASKEPALCAQVDGKTCVACGRCVEVCAYTAPRLAVKKGKGAATIDRNKCVGCTLCSQVCPVNAISMQVRDEAEYLKALVWARPELSK